MKHNEKIAARVKHEIKRLPKEIVPEGVQLLNPGFFLMERVRANTGVKERATVRTTMKEQR